MAENLSAQSPNKLELHSKPQLSGRFNKRAVFIIFGVITAILLVIVFNISKPAPGQGKRENMSKSPAFDTEIEPASNGIQEMSSVFSHSIHEVPPLPPGIPTLPERPTQSAGPTQVVSNREEGGLAEKAMQANTVVADFNQSGMPSGMSSRVPAVPDSASRIGAFAGATEPDANAWQNNRTKEFDINRQAQKQKFLEESAYAQVNTRIVSLKPPASAFEIKTGTIIPAVLITEIISDLPGEIVAQVSQNVFDTATGRYLLIPQGTRLFGRYDSQVAFGQDRLLVVWHRLIYPNAETVELGVMSGNDKAGMAGFGDQVNRHYTRLLGGGLLLSLFSAGAQLSQPRQSSVFIAPTPQQVAAGTFGQEMAQLGIEMARRNMLVQPTIMIRKGHQFTVMVNKDLTFTKEYGS